MNNELDKRELKKLKKEENKKMLKIRNVTGTHYVILLSIVTGVGILVFPNIFEKGSNYLLIASYLWYLAAPLIGAYILMKLHHNTLENCISPKNFKKARNYSIQDLVLIDILYVGFNYSVAIIPAIISCVLASIYIMSEINKICNNNLN